MLTRPNPAPAAQRERPGRRSHDVRTTPAIAAAKPTPCRRLGRSPRMTPTSDRDGRARPGDGRDDADRAGRHAAVEGGEADRADDGRGNRPGDLGTGRGGRARGDDDPEKREPDRLRDGQDREWVERAALDAAEEVAESPGRTGPEGERSCEHASGRPVSRPDAWRRRRRAGSRGTGRPPRPSAPLGASWCEATACRSSARTSASSGVARSSISRRPRWTWPRRRPSACRLERRARPELERPADVVDERGGE